MRTFRLARVAAEAEVLRLKRLAARSAVRAVYGLVSLVFFVATLTGLHATLAIWLLPRFGALYTTLMLTAGDAVIMIGFGLLAAMSNPGAVEREAMQVRDSARQQLVQAATTASILAPIIRLVGSRSMFRVAMAAIIAKVFTSSAKR